MVRTSAVDVCGDIQTILAMRNSRSSGGQKIKNRLTASHRVSKTVAFGDGLPRLRRESRGGKVVRREAEEGKDVEMYFGLSEIWWALGKRQAMRKLVLAGGTTVSPRLTSSHRVSNVSQVRLPRRRPAAAAARE